MQDSLAKYGVDAPGVVAINFALGIPLCIVAVAGMVWPAHIAVWLSLGAAVLAAPLLVVGGAMLHASLVGKMRVRDRLVAALALAPDERVLDAGCGRGLALIGCAKGLTTGKAVGVDLWAAKDQSGNRPAATLANAAAEGVADRVAVETGDITKLPFPDSAFDAVISMTVIHNIPSEALRDQALGELARVLRPGGRMAIFDILNTARYASVLRAAGLEVRSLGRDRLWLMPCESLFVKKPDNP